MHCQWLQKNKEYFSRSSRRTLLWKHNKINSNSIRLFKRTIARKSYWIQFRADFFPSFSHSHVQYLLFLLSLCVCTFYTLYFELERKVIIIKESRLLDRIHTYEKNTRKRQKKHTRYTQYTYARDKPQKNVRWYIAVAQ